MQKTERHQAYNIQNNKRLFGLRTKIIIQQNVFGKVN